MTLKKTVHVVNYGVDKFPCLTHQGQLGYHTNTQYKHHFSSLLPQVPCSFTSTLYPGPEPPTLLNHIFEVYLFLCLIDAHGKTSSLGSHQGPLDPGKFELLQVFYEDDSCD